MKYTISMGDIHETYEGTPEEIVELLRAMPEGIIELGVIETNIEAENLSVDDDEMVDYIYEHTRLKPKGELKDEIREILDAELEFLKLQGIAQQHLL